MHASGHTFAFHLQTKYRSFSVKLHVSLLGSLQESVCIFHSHLLVPILSLAKELCTSLPVAEQLLLHADTYHFQYSVHFHPHSNIQTVKESEYLDAVYVCRDTQQYHCRKEMRAGSESLHNFDS